MPLSSTSLAVPAPGPGRCVLLCCNTAFGLANFRLGLIRALRQAGHTVIAVAPRDAYAETLEREGVTFFDWPLSARSTHPFGEWRAVRALARIYRLAKPDVCLHYTIKPVLYGALVGARQRLPFVSVITGLGYVFLNQGPISWVARQMYRALLRRSYRVWFLNQDDLGQFVESGLVHQAIADVLPGEGVDTDHFAPAELRPPCAGRPTVFLMVSRLLADKGLREFVDACRQLRIEGVAFTAQVLGAPGAENPAAVPREQVDAWVREGVIEYLGRADDVRPFIAAADCVVLPSYREGLPRALLEAASLARPVIATDVPGCRDVVEHGRTGLLCAARSGPDLAAAMQRFIALADGQRADMGRQGRALVEQRFGESVVVQQYQDLLFGLPR